MLFRIVILVRFDGKLFNLRRLKAKTKMQTDVLHELFHAGDMDKTLDQVSQSCDNYDLTFRKKKTERVHRPAPGKPYNEPITVN